MRWLLAPLLVLLLALLACWTAAAEEVPATASNYGGAGLIETRNARFRPDGTLELGAALRRQREFYTLNVQALPFLETTLRLTNRLNGNTGRGTTVDRSFDLKLRLLEEGPLTPALAVGVQDFVGTGLYSGEYVVASKRFWDVDATLGLGWGRLGTGADAPNPFGYAYHGFRTRPRKVGEGGLPAFTSLFRGRDVAVLAGLEWSAPALATPLGAVEGLRLKAELAGDALRDERGGYPARTTNLRGQAASRVNLGLQWQPNEWLDAGLHVVHGTDVLLRLSLRMDAARPPALPTPVLPPLPPRPAPAEASPAPLRDAAFAALRRAGFRPVAVAVEGAEARIAVAGGPYNRLSQVAGRVARAVQPVLPPQVERLRVEWRRAGATTARLVVLRREMEAASHGRGSAEEVLASSRLLPATEAPWPRQAVQPWAAGGGQGIDWGIAPRIPLQFGDPRTAVRWQLMGVAGARAELGAGFAVAGSVAQAVAGNLAKGLPSNSQLPHVRSDLGRYAKQGRTAAIPALYAERIWTPAPDVFARVTAGLLEPMFGGVSSEALWRPVGERYALGLDLAWVTQRQYRQRFAMLGYNQVTGHASAYADLPWWNLYGVVRAGRYLAGDWGGTLELGRRFESGVEIGAFATRTTVPYRRFGEGSFDKGVYLRIPLQSVGVNNAGALGTTLRPVQRDGGQRLAVDNPLWELTRDGRAEALGRGFVGFLR